MDKTSRKTPSKMKLKLNKNPKTKSNRTLKSMEDLDEISTHTFDNELQSLTDHLEKTGENHENTGATKKYKDLAEIPGILVVRGGFNSGFDILARTTREPIRISISGDNLPGLRDDRKQFGVRLGNKITPLPGISPLKETINWECVGQMYDEDDFALAQQDPDEENEEK